MSGQKGYLEDGARNRKAVQATQNSVDETETRTNYRRWRLLDERGRQRWIYLRTQEEMADWPQSLADKYHLGMDVVSTVPSYVVSNQQRIQKLEGKSTIHGQLPIPFHLLDYESKSLVLCAETILK